MGPETTAADGGESWRGGGGPGTSALARDFGIEDDSPSCAVADQPTLADGLPDAARAAAAMGRDDDFSKEVLHGCSHLSARPRG